MTNINEYFTDIHRRGVCLEEYILRIASDLARSGRKMEKLQLNATDYYSLAIEGAPEPFPGPNGTTWLHVLGYDIQVELKLGDARSTITLVPGAE